MNQIIRINVAESHYIYNQTKSNLFVVTKNNKFVSKYNCAESNVIRLINAIELNKRRIQAIRIKTTNNHYIYNQNSSTLCTVSKNYQIVREYKCSKFNIIRLINDIENYKCINQRFYQ